MPARSPAYLTLPTAAAAFFIASFAALLVIWSGSLRDIARPHSSIMHFQNPFTSSSKEVQSQSDAGQSSSALPRPDGKVNIGKSSVQPGNCAQNNVSKGFRLLYKLGHIRKKVSTSGYSCSAPDS